VIDADAADADVAAICVLSRGEAPDVQIEQLSGSGALVALLNHVTWSWLRVLSSHSSFIYFQSDLLHVLLRLRGPSSKQQQHHLLQ
jgi:hypothetical protein